MIKPSNACVLLFGLILTSILHPDCLVPYSIAQVRTSVVNGGFESPVAGEYWRVDASDAHKFSMSLDRTNPKEGNQSLRITSNTPVDVTLRQDLFLPVGTLWRLSGWTKSGSLVDAGDPVSAQLGIETPAGDQGFSRPLASSEQWQLQTVMFRVPSPGRITIALKAFQSQSGEVWFDDIHLERVPESLAKISVHISNKRLSDRPIDLKQGGQFIEPLCDLLPSMIAQQVVSTSFEDDGPWTHAYKKETDRPYRPWYPDGSVHLATYSLDEDRPFNGKRSQKIELPLRTWAGISQDGFFLQSGHSYRLRLHSRSGSGVAIRASLHAGGGVIAGPVLLGHSGEQWTAGEVILTAKRNAQNATLTIEFEGPGTLWLDRVYLIDTNAILGLWRPDVVRALKAMNPGIVRFGGSTIEAFEWQQTLGPWDSRPPYSDDPWGGLQENFVGLEEFVRLARYIGAEPLICIRWTGKSAEDAAHEVEYFNGSPDSTWGRLRVRNGHPEPYKIKYWQIGNEVSGPEYDASVKTFAAAMARIDPSIKILSSFPSADTIRLADGELDYVSPHHYSVGDLDGTEENLQTLQSEIKRDGRGKNIRVAVTEWNTTGGEFGLTRGMLLTLGNALSLSRYQNLLHRYSDLVEIANRSNLSDSFGSGAIQPGPGWLFFAPSYFSQKLYQRAAGSFPLKVEYETDLSRSLQQPDLDATISADGKTLRLYGVNSTADLRTLEIDLNAKLSSGLKGKALILQDSKSPADSEAMNTRDDPRRVSVFVKPAHIHGNKFVWNFPPFSLTLLELDLASKASERSNAK